MRQPRRKRHGNAAAVVAAVVVVAVAVEVVVVVAAVVVVVVAVVEVAAPHLKVITEQGEKAAVAVHLHLRDGRADVQGNFKLVGSETPKMEFPREADGDEGLVEAVHDHPFHGARVRAGCAWERVPSASHPGLHVVPMDDAVTVAHEAKVAARAESHGRRHRKANVVVVVVAVGAVEGAA